MSRYDDQGSRQTARCAPREEPVPWYDNTPGAKPSAYHHGIGRLICARVADGETITSIVTDPAMPCRATLYRWLRVDEDFAAAYRTVRRALAENRLGAEAAARARRRAADLAQRRWPRGRRSTYSPEKALAFCEAVAAGLTLAQIAAHPDLPTPKMVYRWLKLRPEFRELYLRARREQRVRLQLRIARVTDQAHPLNLAATKREVARLEGRIGRLTPKLYRTRF